MWEAACQQCKWTSHEYAAEAVTKSLATLHEHEHPGHQVNVTLRGPEPRAQSTPPRVP